jgi:hypothetical protein
MMKIHLSTDERKEANHMARKKEILMAGAKYLTTVNDQIELDILQSLLASFEISIFVRDALSGSFIRILMGGSVFDTDIFVKEDDYQTAFDAIQGNYENL